MQLSAGGLVSALGGVQGFNTMWVGWPGESTVICCHFMHQSARLCLVVPEQCRTTRSAASVVQSVHKLTGQMQMSTPGHAHSHRHACMQASSCQRGGIAMP